jgi:hypothetical protein
MDKARKEPDASIDSINAEKVLIASLRTIAAFLTSGGGILYVGVDDKANPTGIEWDYRVLPVGRRNPDGWQLVLRDHVRSRFREGDAINDYVRVGFSNEKGVIHCLA